MTVRNTGHVPIVLFALLVISAQYGETMHLHPKWEDKECSERGILEATITGLAFGSKGIAKVPTERVTLQF